MSDQPTMESPQSRLEAMLGDISNEPPMVEQDEPQEEEEELQAEPDLEGEDVEETDEDQSDTEDEVEEDSDEEQTLQTIKLKVNGEEIEKPLDEVVALAQQGLDYTKKTQEVAEQRKEVEALKVQIEQQEKLIQENAQLNNLLIEDVAKITALDQQLAQYNDTDWAKLSDSDFVEAQKQFFNYSQLQQQRNNLVSQFEAKRQDAQQKQQQLITEKIAKGKEQLSKKIPNWGPETIQGLILAGKEYYNFTDAELNGIVDPRQVEVLNDARQWRELQKNKGVTKKKVASAKPVVKPGSKDPKTISSSNQRKLREQLRKTGNQELASQLIENMI